MPLAQRNAPGAPLPQVEDSWKAALAGEMAKPSFQQLQKFVHGEWAGPTPVYPPPELVFRAFNSCPLDQVRARPAHWVSPSTATIRLLGLRQCERPSGDLCAPSLPLHCAHARLEACGGLGSWERLLAVHTRAEKPLQKSTCVSPLACATCVCSGLCIPITRRVLKCFCPAPCITLLCRFGSCLLGRTPITAPARRWASASP